MDHIIEHNRPYGGAINAVKARLSFPWVGPSLKQTNPGADQPTPVPEAQAGP